MVGRERMEWMATRERKKITWPKKGTTHFKILWHFFRTVSQNFTFNSIYFRLFTAYFCSGFFVFPVQRITTTSNYTYIYLYSGKANKENVILRTQTYSVLGIEEEKKEMLLALSHDCIWNPFGKWIQFFFSAVLPFSVSFHLVHCVDQWHEKKSGEKTELSQSERMSFIFQLKM